MTILTIRTDNEQAELGIFNDHQQLEYLQWQAHRQLAESINLRISEILNKSSISLDQLQGIVCYKGPGSFTGLRIGLSVANALAYSLQIPIVATGTSKWLETGVNDLLAGSNQQLVSPEYGQLPNITPPSK